MRDRNVQFCADPSYQEMIFREIEEGQVFLLPARMQVDSSYFLALFYFGVARELGIKSSCTVPSIDYLYRTEN